MQQRAHSGGLGPRGDGSALVHPRSLHPRDKGPRAPLGQRVNDRRGLWIQARSGGQHGEAFADKPKGNQPSSSPCLNASCRRAIRVEGGCLCPGWQQAANGLFLGTRTPEEVQGLLMGRGGSGRLGHAASSPGTPSTELESISAPTSAIAPARKALSPGPQWKDMPKGWGDILRTSVTGDAANRAVRWGKICQRASGKQLLSFPSCCSPVSLSALAVFGCS